MGNSDEERYSPCDAGARSHQRHTRSSGEMRGVPRLWSGPRCPRPAFSEALQHGCSRISSRWVTRGVSSGIGWSSDRSAPQSPPARCALTSRSGTALLPAAAHGQWSANLFRVLPPDSFALWRSHRRQLLLDTCRDCGPCFSGWASSPPDRSPPAPQVGWGSIFWPQADSCSPRRPTRRLWQVGGLAGSSLLANSHQPLYSGSTWKGKYHESGK